MKLCVILLLFISSSAFSQMQYEEYYNWGIDKMNVSSYEDAVYYFNKSLEVFPNVKGEEGISDASGYYHYPLSEKRQLIHWYLNYCYYQLNQIDKAIDICQKWIGFCDFKVITNDNSWEYNYGPYFVGFECYYLGNAHYFLGLNYQKIKNYELAIKSFHKVLCFTVNKGIKNREETHKKALMGILECNKLMGIQYGILEAQENGIIFYCSYGLYSSKYHWWNYNTQGKQSCIYEVSLNFENLLPIKITHLEVEVIIKDNKDVTLYKKSHWVEINLYQNEIAQSNYFQLANQVCLPVKYVNSDKFNIQTNVKKIAYQM